MSIVLQIGIVVWGCQMHRLRGSWTAGFLWTILKGRGKFVGVMVKAQQLDLRQALCWLACFGAYKLLTKQSRWWVQELEFHSWLCGVSIRDMYIKIRLEYDGHHKIPGIVILPDSLIIGMIFPSKYGCKQVSGSPWYRFLSPPYYIENPVPYGISSTSESLFTLSTHQPIHVESWQAAHIRANTCQILEYCWPYTLAETQWKLDYMMETFCFHVDWIWVAPFFVGFTWPI